VGGGRVGPDDGGCVVEVVLVLVVVDVELVLVELGLEPD